MVTETQLGNYYPSVNKNKIVFSSMGNNGFDIYTSSFEEMESVLDYSQNIEPT